MKFNKKFNIKKLVKISAVALAMISAGGVASAINANTNVHADVVSRDIAIANKMNRGQSAQIKRDETHAEIEGDRSDPSALAEDIAYNKSFVEKHKSQIMSGLSNKTKSAVKKQVEADDGDAQPDTSSKSSDSDVKMPSIFNVSTHNSSKESNSSKKSTPRLKATKSPKRTRLSKATVRKIMKQIRADKAIVRDDKKQLSSRKVRKTYRKYKKTGKASRYARRYMFYHEDEVRYEKKLNHLIKLVHTSRATKHHHARKALTKVRKSHNYKNRKNSKRNHKRITKHNRNRKHIKYNAKRTHKNRK